MKRQTRNINNAIPMVNFSKRKPEEDFLLDCEDSALQESINEYMKGRVELEDVKSDPGLAEIEPMVIEMISDYSRNKSKNKDNEKFIRSAFSEIPEEKILEEIGNIRKELSSNTINEITAEWVNEWHKSRQKNGAFNARREEIRDFITSSLETEEEKTDIPVLSMERKSGARALYLRYASLSAAAVLGTFLMIKTLVPDSDPDRLFSKYYEPFDAVSPVTRSAGDNTQGNAATAIELYKAAEYLGAIDKLTSAIKNDPSDAESIFYMGLAEVEIGNYANAIKVLSGISDRPGQYARDAKWYLGMAYMRTGQKEKAIECFSSLAKHEGYYSKRSEKILRHLE